MLAPPIAAAAPLSITMFKTPAPPSASYFAPGLVTTSILLTIEAGIALNTWLGADDIIILGLPSTYTLKELEPLTVILSSPSTVTIGTLRSISRTVAAFASASFFTS